MNVLKPLNNKILEHNKVDRVIHLMPVLGGFRELSEPQKESELSCLLCGTKKHDSIIVQPRVDSRRYWICENSDCEAYKQVYTLGNIKVAPMSRRALEWAKFCEFNGLGKSDHTVTFESVNQNPEKLAYLKKFAQKPSGMIIWQGDTGTGKTYGALGACEYFTRFSSDCIFISQRDLHSRWLELIKENDVAIKCYLRKVEECCLLVIDDFATKDPSSGFLDYFMGLIDKRLKWDNLGTIITTNLDYNAIRDICGDALTDRLATGQIFKSTGKSRREKI